MQGYHSGNLGNRITKFKNYIKIETKLRTEQNTKPEEILQTAAKIKAKTKAKTKAKFIAEVEFINLKKIDNFLPVELYIKYLEILRNFFKSSGIIPSAMWLLKQLLDLIYPRRCPVCQEIIGIKGKKVCPDCDRKVQRIMEPRCRKCGKPIEHAEAEYCYDCTRVKHYYDKGCSVWVYDEFLKRSIYQYKYHNKRIYAEWYTEHMVAEYGRMIKGWKPDALIPIPLHRSKQRKRGFNQAEVLAKGLGKALQIPVKTHIVHRIKNTIPQKELNDKERQNNLKKAFIIYSFDVKLRTVVLVDDIYTTGSTLDAVAGILKKQGVQSVYFICIASGRGF